MLPSPIYLPGYREGDALFRVCQARLFSLFSTAGSNNHLARTLFSVCKPSVLTSLWLLSLPLLTSVASWWFFILGVYPNASWNYFFISLSYTVCMHNSITLFGACWSNGLCYKTLWLFHFVKVFIDVDLGRRLALCCSLLRLSTSHTSLVISLNSNRHPII